ncbi:MAG: hypothetical protein IJ563_11560 [Selenomonadaceae bacterium]|nr:hypothetical protein [Selenomonadaceae bacterium]MBR1858651.1 hypothetical protein [Selenomonadaceae bacterium]
MDENKNDSQSNSFPPNGSLSVDESKSDINLKDKSEPQNETSNGIFNISTKYKWIFMLSILILIVTSILIYAKWNNVLGAEYWQMAVWGLCGILSIYAIFRKSLAALLFNLVLFFGISLIPAWGLVYQFFKPIIELLTGTQLPEWHQIYYR